MRTLFLRVVVATVALSAFAAAVVTSHFAFIAAGGIALFFLATSFSEAAHTSSYLRQLIHANVDVQAWGVTLPLPVPFDQPLTLAAVNAFGAGLHLYLRSGTSARPMHLKVAQPKQITFTADGLIVESAAYVQWLGRSLRKVSGKPAVTLRYLSPAGSSGGGLTRPLEPPKTRITKFAACTVVPRGSSSAQRQQYVRPQLPIGPGADLA